LGPKSEIHASREEGLTCDALRRESPHAMAITLFNVEDGLTTLTLDGRLDAAAILELQPEFMEKTVALAKPALVDVSQVSFIASMCIRMFVLAAKGLQPHGARLGLLKPSDIVEKALRSSGFDRFVGVYHDEAAARQSLLHP
jgi:anti-anti-sigma factor